jgi:hypothetical protein
VRKFLEKGITTKQDAELLAHQYVNSQYDNERSWTVNALPNRFDIYPGDVATFYTLSAGLSGKFRVFDVKYTYSVSSLTVTLSIGKPRRNLLSALKYTTSN